MTRRILIGLLFTACGLAQESPPLAGIALDPMAQPVVNGTVTARIDGELVALGRSDGSGTFLLRNLPRRAMQLRITTTTPDIGAVALDLTTDPPAGLVVRVGPARAVQGVVRDAAGTALAGALVTCTPLGAEFAAAADLTSTDANGHYAFAAMPYGDCALRVWVADHAGYAAVLGGGIDLTHDVVLTDDPPVTHTFVLRGASAAQLAAAHLELSAEFRATSVLLPPVLRRPERDGSSWRLAGWANCDRIRARLVADGFAVDPGEREIGPDLPDRTKPFDVADDEVAEPIRGQLVDREGHPAMGITLLLTGRDGELQTCSDAAGAFAFAAQRPHRSSWLLHGADPSLALTNDDGAERVAPGPQAGLWLPGRRCPPLRLAVRPAASLTGRLVDARGTPIVGAEVQLLSTTTAPATEGNFATRPIHYFAHEELATARSGSDGRFAIRGTPLPGPLLLQAIGGGSLGRFDVTFDKVTDLGTCQLGPAGSLVGVVHCDDGSPAPGARVQVVDYGSGQPRSRWLTADRAGRFALHDVPPGPCRVEADGRRAEQVVAEVGPGAATEVTIGP